MTPEIKIQFVAMNNRGHVSGYRHLALMAVRPGAWIKNISKHNTDVFAILDDCTLHVGKTSRSDGYRRSQEHKTWAFILNNCPNIVNSICPDPERYAWDYAGRQKFIEVAQAILIRSKLVLMLPIRIIDFFNHVSKSHYLPFVCNK